MSTSNFRLKSAVVVKPRWVFIEKCRALCWCKIRGNVSTSRDRASASQKWRFINQKKRWRNRKTFGVLGNPVLRVLSIRIISPFLIFFEHPFEHNIFKWITRWFQCVNWSVISAGVIILNWENRPGVLLPKQDAPVHGSGRPFSNHNIIAMIRPLSFIHSKRPANELYTCSRLHRDSRSLGIILFPDLDSLLPPWLVWLIERSAEKSRLVLRENQSARVESEWIWMELCGPVTTEAFGAPCRARHVGSI